MAAARRERPNALRDPSGAAARCASVVPVTASYPFWPTSVALARVLTRLGGGGGVVVSGNGIGSCAASCEPRG